MIWAEPQEDLKHDELFGRLFEHYDGFLEFILWLHSFGIPSARSDGKIWFYCLLFMAFSEEKKKKEKRRKKTAL